MNRETQFALLEKLHCSSRRRETLISQLKKKKNSLGCSSRWRSKNFRFCTNDEEEAGLNPTGIPKEEQLISRVSRSITNPDYSTIIF